MIYELDGQKPEFPEAGRYWVAPNATLIGKVRLRLDASVWFGAVLRGDNEWIELGERSQIQDNATLHTDPGFPLTIGPNCVIGHNVILHGCTVGANSLIGMGAIMLNGARIGANSLVGAGALVTEGKTFPDNSLIVGSPARAIRTLDEAAIKSIAGAADIYVRRFQAIREGAEGDLMTVVAAETSEGLIRWRYLPWALAAIAAMIAVIVAGNIWLLDFVHVFSSLLWTGVDLFMGFVLGPILRRVDLSVRREIVRRLTPRTLFLMPTVSIISGTTGWFLAVQLGYTALDWPAYWWVAAALILVTLMTIQGLGFLTPVNVYVCLQLQKPEPDMRKISSWMRWYFYAVALQGLMQVAIIVVMTRFRAGI